MLYVFMLQHHGCCAEQAEDADDGATCFAIDMGDDALSWHIFVDGNGVWFDIGWVYDDEPFDEGVEIGRYFW